MGKEPGRRARVRVRVRVRARLFHVDASFIPKAIVELASNYKTNICPTLDGSVFDKVASNVPEDAFFCLEAEGLSCVLAVASIYCHQHFVILSMHVQQWHACVCLGLTALHQTVYAMPLPSELDHKSSHRLQQLNRFQHLPIQIILYISLVRARH